MSVGDWVVTYLIMLIPLVNNIMLFVWAFSGGTPVRKVNWAKASLIWLLIGVIFYIIVFAVLGAALFGATRSA